jgi:ribosomal-protein-alanine N-acetyltransferase
LAGDFSVADTTVNVPHPYLDGLAEKWISMHPGKYEREEAVTYGITLKNGSKLIGVIGLVVTKQFRRAELGYWIGQSFWNQGYTTEAARATVEFGFNILALHKIEASHFYRNPTSGRVLKKIGFVEEGILRDHIIKWGRYEDLVVFGLVSTKK